ncbi:MAG: type II toxin-antitoxin system HicB family antitoxin [Candidatus Riflebacteria bacterium]|nr:type II toxin-antitoxin system HicB family antitoxin [Candidatus Riflebacteria bacterium]
MIFPIELSVLGNKTIKVSFPDIPSAITCGKNEEHAIEMALDCLLTVFTAYMHDGDALPQPSRIKRGQKGIEIPPMVAIKMAIYQAMKERGITQNELGTMLSCDARQIRRLLDLDHNSRFDQIETALHVLGLKLAMAVEKAA